MNKFFIALLSVFVLASCSSVSTFRDPYATVFDKAQAVCSDLQTSAGLAHLSIGIASATSQGKMKEYIDNKIQPLLLRIDDGISAYCTIVPLTESTKDVKTLLTKEQEIRDLINYVLRAVGTNKR